MKASKFKRKYSQLEKLFSHDERFQLYAEHELAQLDYESTMYNRYHSGFKNGEKKGHEKGLEEGRKEGLEEGRKEGIKEGIKEGALDEKQSTVMRLLQNNAPLSFITIASALSEQAIRDIAQKNGIPIA